MKIVYHECIKCGFLAFHQVKHECTSRVEKLIEKIRQIKIEGKAPVIIIYPFQVN